MSSKQKSFISLAIIVIGFYLGLTYIPQIVGTCMDGACGFSAGEIIISFAIPLAFIALPVGLEMALFQKGLSQALSDVGITRFRWRGVGIAFVYVVPLLLFFPVVSVATNAPVSVQPNWGWLIVNVILVNGFAEEIMMRGFIFRHLREGRPFWRAAALSTVFFAVYHIPLIFARRGPGCHRHHPGGAGGISHGLQL
ncbi:MAG: CPBP family intramembrane metalloprotease [Chloroflexi bacterium]|nr:CPBP family intramembrane metalloprotease [Chloroflexota bacterium]